MFRIQTSVIASLPIPYNIFLSPSGCVSFEVNWISLQDIATIPFKPGPSNHFATTSLLKIQHQKPV